MQDELTTEELLPDISEWKSDRTILAGATWTFRSNGQAEVLCTMQQKGHVEFVAYQRILAYLKTIRKITCIVCSSIWPNAKPSSPVVAGRLIGGVPVSADATFSTFIPGISNCRALDAAEQVAYGRLREETLFLYGPAGVGKTHLVQAIVHAYLEQGMVATYMSGASFIAYVAEGASMGTSAYRSRLYDLITADVLVIDDAMEISSTNNKPIMELRDIIQRYFDTNKPVVFSSRNPPSNLSLPDTIVSRMSSGVCVGIDIPDRDLRGAILVDEAARRNVIFAPEAIQYAASLPVTDIRRLHSLVIAAAMNTTPGHQVHAEQILEITRDIPKRSKARGFETVKVLYEHLQDADLSWKSQSLSQLQKASRTGNLTNEQHVVRDTLIKRAFETRLVTLAQLSLMFGISKQRISFIIKTSQRHKN